MSVGVKSIVDLVKCAVYRCFLAWCVDEVDVGFTRILAFLSVFYTPLKVCKIATFHKKTYSN